MKRIEQIKYQLQNPTLTMDEFMELLKEASGLRYATVKQQRAEKAASKPKYKPSARAKSDARMLLGKGVYNTPGNYLFGDGYFAKSCLDKYGEKDWNAACEAVRLEN